VEVSDDLRPSLADAADFEQGAPVNLRTHVIPALPKAQVNFKAFDKIMRRRGGKLPREGDEMPR
jgi:hypothetical protein